MSEPDHSNSTHPGPGWRQLSPGEVLKEGDVFYGAANLWKPTDVSGSSVTGNAATYFRYEPAPPLTPEERAVIDAMRAGRKVTVEPEPKPPMPRRCWAYYEDSPKYKDPWGGAFRIGKQLKSDEGEDVQLIELTPAVVAALAAAGIEYEDSQKPVGKPLPEGLPPLPDGAVYLGGVGEFESKVYFHGWCWSPDRPTWDKGTWVGVSRTFHYAAPANSEIVRLNQKGAEQ